MRNLAFTVALLLLPLTVSAQGGPPGLSLGAGLVLSDSAYRGSGSRFIPIPAVRYESESLYLLGLEAGLHVFTAERWQADVFASGRLDGADDIQLPGIASEVERDDAIDIGGRLTYRSGSTSVAATLKRDALGVSDGAELGIKASRVFAVGRGFITPSLGVRLLNARLADYYFGTLANEVAAGAAIYRPGSASIVEIGVTGLRPLQGGRWALFSQVTFGQLSDQLSDSPLLDSDTTGAVIAGATYQF